MKVGHCKKCGHRQHVGEQVMGKVGMAVALAVVGGNAFKHPLAALLGAGIGTAIGHAIDENVLPSCPSCGVALQLIGSAL